MRLLQELIYTDVGLMSLAVLVIILGMGVFFLALFLRKPPAAKRGTGKALQTKAQTR